MSVFCWKQDKKNFMCLDNYKEIINRGALLTEENLSHAGQCFRQIYKLQTFKFLFIFYNKFQVILQC